MPRPQDPAAAGLTLVDLDQPSLEGYRRFISCWVRAGAAGPSFVVDPGPMSTAEVLLEELDRLGVADLDLILLTHIHLDHGGATARLLEAFPGARVVSHQEARRHLADPARLWEGSREVLGAVAEAYGAPRPVPESRLLGYDEAAALGVQVVETPGHAPHHVSFVHDGTLFLGEAAGTFADLGGPGWYLRPATPPRFLQEVALASLDRLLALDALPARLAFAHHGLLEGASAALLRHAREQLTHWVGVVAGTVAARPDADFDTLADTIMATLAATDAHYALGRLLPDDIRARERDYTRQTLRGMVQYVRENAGRAAPPTRRA